MEYRARTGIQSRTDYERMYRRSVDDPAGFWAEMAAGFVWERKVRYFRGQALCPACALISDAHLVWMTAAERAHSRGYCFC